MSKKKIRFASDLARDSLRHGLQGIVGNLAIAGEHRLSRLEGIFEQRQMELILDEENLRKAQVERERLAESCNARREACDEAREDVHVQNVGNQKLGTFLAEYTLFCTNHFGGEVEFGPMPPKRLVIYHSHFCGTPYKH
jgi:hypothetical protein